MNARNFLYISRFNKPSAKRSADNKLETKKLLIENDISTGEILHVFSTRKSIKSYSWNLPEQGFVIKPARGYGGEGILVFEKWEGDTGTTLTGETYSLKRIKSHILDIFDGIYSLQSLPDKAYIEERLIPSPFFKKLAPMGLADIRVIVFNKVPIMAMLRLPTEASHGKANLHQGGIGIGIGLRTGITKDAAAKNQTIEYIPGTKIKTRGIKIPQWDEVLLLSSKTQIVSGLGYAGVDIVFDETKGPVVLEVNARPGLSIQSVNVASLRSRLERIEDLNVATPERGVEIAKSVFAEDFSDKVNDGKKILSVIEPVILSNNKKVREYRAKLDTGAYRTSLDLSVVEELGLPILNRKIVTISASGRQTRPAVRVQFRLGGKRISTIATVATRSHLRFPIIVGRRDLRGFHINPIISFRKEVELIPEDSDLEDNEWEE
jgi:alpha-L-glutamate ligase-like protein